jgi:hypothetical protein
MGWFKREPAAEGHQPAGPTHGPARGDAFSAGQASQSASPAPLPAPSPSPSSFEVAQYARLATTPMPFDVESTHEAVIVGAVAFDVLRQDGPNPAVVLAQALEDLGQEASKRGCDGVWAVQHTMSVDRGVVFVSVIGTGSRPIVDLDQPPPGSRG